MNGNRSKFHLVVDVDLGVELLLGRLRLQVVVAHPVVHAVDLLVAKVLAQEDVAEENGLHLLAVLDRHVRVEPQLVHVLLKVGPCVGLGDFWTKIITFSHAKFKV